MARRPPPEYQITLLNLDDESEVGFLYNSWLLSYQEGKPHDEAKYFATQRAVIDAILAGDTLVLAAREVANPEALLGYVVVERIDAGMVVHWVNVKSIYRRAGIAYDLVEAALGYMAGDGVGTRVYYSHRTRFDHVAERLGLVYLPIEEVA